jgi:proteasome alpha subunit
MVFDEPYRWVDAINQRRDYIEEQLKRSSPVVAVSVEEGILLLSFYRRTSKIFEIYDRMAMGAIGHPADIEMIRMAAINTSHVEGFTRSSRDVSMRRLTMFTLSPKLKSSFEDVMSSPLIYRGIFVETGASPREDLFYELDFDGQVKPSKISAVISNGEDLSDRIRKMLPSTVLSGKEALPVLVDACVSGSLDFEEAGMDADGKILDEDLYRRKKELFLSEREPDIQLLDRRTGLMRSLPLPSMS